MNFRKKVHSVIYVFTNINFMINTTSRKKYRGEYFLRTFEYHHFLWTCIYLKVFLLYNLNIVVLSQNYIL